MKKPFFILLLITTVSCIRPEPVPSDVIAKDSIVPILVAIHLAEAKVSVNNFSEDSVKLSYAPMRKEIFKKYHVTEAKFDSSMSFYSRNVKHLDDIYEKVVDSLGELESNSRAKNNNK